MKTVVCDVSPIIFLARLNRLHLIADVLGGRIHVLQCVVDELRSESAGAVESARLAKFLKTAKVVSSRKTRRTSQSLSQCDRYTLTWAIENNADWLVCDERLLRRIAVEEGLRVVGFPGLLVQGAKEKHLSPVAARKAVNEAVARYGCRISVALFQRILEELDAI